MLNLESKIPNHIKAVMRAIEDNGFEAFLVGGAVRDLLLDKTPKDYDLATSAFPDDIKRLFRTVKLTGEKYGTVTVIENGNLIEVTTFRQDGNYTDNRRPDEVVFTSSIVDDLARRDFTINSMAYSLQAGFLDPFEGKEDLRNGIIKAVGISQNRFLEDPLRMIRAVRFSSQLLLSNINSETSDSIKSLNNNLSFISKERIRDEFNKILLSSSPVRGIELLIELGLMKHVVPELLKTVDFDQHNIHHNKNVFDHTTTALFLSEEDLILRLAILFHDIGKPDSFKLIDGRGTFYGHHKISAKIAEEVMTRLKYDNATIDTVVRLVRSHMYNRFNIKRISNRIVNRLINKVGVENLDVFFVMIELDIASSAPPFDFTNVNKLRHAVNEYLSKEIPVTVTDLAVNGYDLMDLGIAEGPTIGEMLRYLHNKVLDDERLNVKSQLLSLVEYKLKVANHNGALHI